MFRKKNLSVDISRADTKDVLLSQPIVDGTVREASADAVSMLPSSTV